MGKPLTPVSMTAPLNMAYLPLATSFTENAALALGLSRPEALRLTLASEELFGYLSKVSGKDEVASLIIKGGGYYVQLKLQFKTRNLDLRFFNLTASLSPDDEQDLENLGLLLASRSVEHFSLKDNAQEGLSLTLTKDKTYPPSGQPAPEPLPLNDFEVKEAGPEDLIMASRLLTTLPQADLYPPAFALPGKLRDMADAGDLDVLAARDRAGHVGGVILWNRLGPKTARIHGPYIFNQPLGPNMASALVEACLARLGKSDAMGVICLYPPPEMPAEFFEPLGTIDFHGPEGGSQTRPCLYRQLQEDPGGVVWAHPVIHDFLEGIYLELALARQINPPLADESSKPPHSVIAVEFNRDLSLATLRPIWDGQDAAQNLKQHVRILGSEGIQNIFCEIDLARAWQAELAKHIVEQGFQPRLLLPYGGDSDLLIFQHRQV